LPALWQRLHLAGHIHGGVIIDPRHSDGDAIVGFGLSTFLDDDFLVRFLESPRPHLSAVVYEHLLRGDDIVLPPKRVAIDNATGRLNLAILHFGQRYQPSDDRAREVAVAAQMGFRAGHFGYRLNRVVQEAHGEGELPFFASGGFLLKDDYRRYYEESQVAPPGARERPYLMGLYRDDPESRYPGTAASDLFTISEPRFNFSFSEQRVLLHAVMDEPDEAIAEALGVSRDAIKKAWRRIFDRVASAEPGLIDADSDLDRTRGKEKRRPLIQYLRHHLEELRPFKRAR
jgi:hypothetical protein